MSGLSTLWSVCCIIPLWFYWTTPYRIFFLICLRCLPSPGGFPEPALNSESLLLQLCCCSQCLRRHSCASFPLSYLHLFPPPGYITVPPSPSWPVSSRLIFFSIKPDRKMLLTSKGLFEYNSTVLWYKDTEQSNPWHRPDWTHPLDRNSSSFGDTRGIRNWGGRCGSKSATDVQKSCGTSGNLGTETCFCCLWVAM